MWARKVFLPLENYAGFQWEFPLKKAGNASNQEQSSRKHSQRKNKNKNEIKKSFSLFQGISITSRTIILKRKGQQWQASYIPHKISFKWYFGEYMVAVRKSSVYIETLQPFSFWVKNELELLNF